MACEERISIDCARVIRGSNSNEKTLILFSESFKIPFIKAEEYLLCNLQFISCFEKFHYYAILQPISSTEKIITDEEKQNLINFENHYNQTIINLDNYNDKMKRIMT